MFFKWFASESVHFFLFGQVAAAKIITYLFIIGKAKSFLCTIPGPQQMFHVPDRSRGRAQPGTGGSSLSPSLTYVFVSSLSFPVLFRSSINTRPFLFINPKPLVYKSCFTDAKSDIFYFLSYFSWCPNSESVSEF